MRWILQGSLYDPFDEFFVKSIENVNEEKASKDDHIIDEDSLENPLNNKFQLRVEMIPWFGFYVLNFLSVLLDFLFWEKLTQKWLQPKAEQSNK